MNKKTKTERSKLTRRQLLARTAGAAAAFTIVPRFVLGGPKFVAPSEKVYIAIIGCGGQGRTNSRSLFGQDDAQIVAIADPMDEAQNEVIRIIEARDESTPVGRLLLHLHDSTAAMEEFDAGVVDMSDPDQVAIYKTIRVLKNEMIYADSYLRT